VLTTVLNCLSGAIETFWYAGTRTILAIILTRQSLLNFAYVAISTTTFPSLAIYMTYLSLCSAMSLLIVE
jgi:hypothetical protein